MNAADICSKNGWPDRVAVLYFTWQCQRLYIRRQELRFGYLYSCGEFESGAWNSLSSVTDRLDKNWTDRDESGALRDLTGYRELTAEIAEAEIARESFDKDLLDGPFRTLQQNAEYRIARQTIYEKVNELDNSLDRLFAQPDNREPR